MKILIKKILDSKLVIMLEFENTKTFLLKDILKICQKKFLLLAKLKIQFRGLMLLVSLNGKPINGSFYEKELQKTQEKFKIEKVTKKKE